MASARPNDSDHVLNYYKLLGVNENASYEEILHAFRLRAREVHPDKNPEDNVEATKEFQLLAEAKIGLVDPERRRNLDERLIDNGVRNWNALPLLCSICTNSKSRVCSRCLKGMGHKNPLIDEFNLASKEFKDKMKTTSKTSPGRNKFVVTLPTVLKKFIATDLHRLYPLAANRKKSPCSKEDVCPVPTDVRTCWSGSGINMPRSVVPSAADVVEILNLSLFLESKMLPPSTEIPIYDLSCLSNLELEQMLQYFGLPSRKPFSRDLVIEELSTFIPKCTIASTQSDGYQDRLRHVCQQCARTRFSITFLFSSFTTCFACTKVCCSECLSSVQRKMPTRGSYELRSLCKTCLITLNSREAASWLTHGQYLIATDKKYLEAALAMYNLSNELCPSEIATIRQAQALFSCEKHERVVQYGKGILRTATFERENTQELQTLAAESLLKVAHDADDSDLLEKAGKYEEVIKWTEQFTEEGGAMVHDLKVEAMKRRLHYFEVHERVTNQRVQVLFLNLNAAIREGSLLKVFILLQDMDEEAKNMCLKKLSTESPETYTQYGKLLLQLTRAMVGFKLDPAGAVSEMADIFWNGYSIFLTNGSREHISNVLMHFICQLLEGRQSLLIETLPEITPTNFLQCLYLTEDDIFSPPDIEDRLWENLHTGYEMKMFLKYEIAVKKLSESKKWTPVEVALSYYDLIDACIHLSQLLLTLITSVQWFARQISLPNSDHALQYSCKKMIVKLTNLAAALAFEFVTPPHLQYYVARMVLGLQFYASSKTPFGSQEDAETIGKHLNWLVTAGRLCPLHKIPIVSPTESVILWSVSHDLYSEYLLKLQDGLPPQMRPMSEAILRYHIYENHRLGLCKLEDPTGDGLRLTAMTELLHANDWSWDGVQQLLQLNMVPLDSKGWLVANHRLLEPVLSSGIRRLVGLEIDKHNFRIHLLKRDPTRLSSSLLCWEDVATGLTLDHPGCYFTLEPVTPQETFYHPFNEQKFKPKELKASRFLNTLFHTDYLLMQLSTGFEISSYPPFHMRPVHEGLLKGLPDELKKALASVPSRGPSRSQVDRFWLQADAMEYDIQESDDSVRFLFGDVHMSVRCQPMFYSQDGILQDQDVLGSDPNSPEGSFFADFTKNYDQIGKYFPEFLRLKELCKVQWLGTFVARFEKSLKKHRSLFTREFSTLKNSCKKFLSSTKLVNGCCWVPAACHCDDGRCIYGGVALKPELRKVSLKLRRNFSRCPLTPIVFQCHEGIFHVTVKLPQVKAFNPTRTSGRELLSTNGDVPSTGPPGGDCRGSASASDRGKDCGNNGSLSGKGGGDGGGNSIHKKLREDVERIKKTWGLNEGNRIEKDKHSPKCRQYHTPCRHGENAWEIALRELSGERCIPPGKELPKAEDQPDKDIKSALDSIKKGNKPWENEKFGFRGYMVSPNGKFKWNVIVRGSSKDRRPTTELYLSFTSDGLEFNRRIKIRYGNKLKP